MEQRNFYLIKFLPLMEGWAILCGLFGFFFILARANFATPHLEKLFIQVYLFYLFATAIFGIFIHGGFRMLGIKFEHKDVLLINLFVLNGHIDPSIPDEKLKELFHHLKKENSVGLWKAIAYSSFVILASTITIYFIGASLSNILVILIGGCIAIALLSLFPLFVGELFFANLLRECRKMLSERNLQTKEKIQLYTLKNRFYYFVFLFALITGIILSFVTDFSFSVLAIFATGLIMVVIIARALFFSIFSVFQEIRDFADELAKGKRAKYYAGSSYKEVLDLSEDLNKSAKSIYEAKEQEKIAMQELGKQKGEVERSNRELQKWYELTVGRELKMVELKEKIRELEKDN